MPAHQPDDLFEDRLSAALHQTGGTFDSPRTELTAAGARRGRRMQVQRRAVIAGSVTALALVGVGGSLLLPGGGTPGTTPASLAASGSKATSKVYTGDDVVHALRKLLPKGKFTKTLARGTDEDLPPLAVGVFDDGKGPGSVSLGLGRIPKDAGEIDPAAQVMPCPEEGQGGLDSCETGLLPDGTAVTVYQGYEYPDRREDTKSWGADLITPAGHHVSLIEWNAPAEKGEPVSRPEPPLTTAQLKKVAGADVWRRIIDAMPEEERPADGWGTPGGAGQMPDYLVMRKLALLLPKGLERTVKDSQDGYGSFVLDDGKGESLVQVNVQPGMSDVADKLYGADAETLPDGTRVATRQEPGEKRGKGVVMWTVDTMRKDGLRVVVSAFNTGDQNKDATRAKPALTIEQLREIALSPRWTSHED